MERKLSSESHNKGQVQADVEGKRKRHKGGTQPTSDHSNKDADISMETAIYKLDSKNKIVLEPADNKNTDAEFLKYVRNRVEQNAESINANKGDRTKYDAPMQYSSDAKYDLKKNTQNETLSAKEQTMPNEGVAVAYDEDQMLKSLQIIFQKLCALSNNGEARVEIAVQQMDSKRNSVYSNATAPISYQYPMSAAPQGNYNYMQRTVPETATPRISYPYAAQQQSTTPRASIPVASTSRASAQIYHRFTDPKAQLYQAMPNEQVIFGDEEQMLKSLQIIFQKLYEMSNNGEARVEIAVQQSDGYRNSTYSNASTSKTSYRYSAQSSASQQQSTTLQDSTPRASLQIYYRITDSRRPTLDFSGPFETRVLGKQFDVATEERPPSANEDLIRQWVGAEQNFEAMEQRPSSANEDIIRQSVGAEQNFEAMEQRPSSANDDVIMQSVDAEQNFEAMEQRPSSANYDVIMQSADAEQNFEAMEQRPSNFNEDIVRESVGAEHEFEAIEMQQSQQYEYTNQVTQEQAQEQCYYDDQQHLHANELNNLAYKEHYPTGFNRQRALLLPPSQAPGYVQCVAVQPNAMAQHEDAKLCEQQCNQSHQICQLPPMTFRVVPCAGRGAPEPKPSPSYPLYPYGAKNGLQDISPENVRNENGRCCCRTPAATLSNNESYEYILMCVKKNNQHCPT